MTLLWVMIAIVGVIVLLLGSSVRVINQYQRGVVLRFGRLREGPRGPGLTLIAPGADRLHKVNMQVITMPVPAQEGITRDNVTVKVDAVGLLPGHRPGPGRGRRPELRRGHRAGRAGVAAVDHRQERPRRPAVQPGAAQHRAWN